MRKKIFTPQNPVIRIGYNENILDLYTQIIAAIKTEKPGYQPAICGAALYILGQLDTIGKQSAIYHSAQAGKSPGGPGEYLKIGQGDLRRAEF